MCLKMVQRRYKAMPKAAKIAKSLGYESLTDYLIVQCEAMVPRCVVAEELKTHIDTLSSWQRKLGIYKIKVKRKCRVCGKEFTTDNKATYNCIRHRVIRSEKPAIVNCLHAKNTPWIVPNSESELLNNYLNGGGRYDKPRRIKAGY